MKILMESLIITLRVLLLGLKNQTGLRHNPQIMVRSERIELSWTKSTQPSTVPVYQFQHDRNMSHNKLMTIMFQIDNFYYGIYTRSSNSN